MENLTLLKSNMPKNEWRTNGAFSFGEWRTNGAFSFGCKNQ